MRRYLIVANRTLGGHHLIERIHQAIADEPSVFRVVVPVPQRAPAGVEEAAWHRLAAQLERLGSLSADATGNVVHADPYDATVAALEQFAVDELIVCTLPAGLSRWLRMDLVGRLPRSIDAPITHIVTPAGMPERVTAQAVRLSI